jgi:hypothetical protein
MFQAAGGLEGNSIKICKEGEVLWLWEPAV